MEEKYNTIINKLFKNNMDNFVFVYTPSKVGSTSLVTSLRVSLGNLYNIIHIHDEMMLYVLTGITDITVNEIIKYLGSLGKRVVVIDVYRTPIERKMSVYFEKLESFHFNKKAEELKKYPIEKIINRFDNIMEYIETEDYYLEKYDLEKRKNFDFEKKYIIQKEKGIYYIKLRLCDSNEWGKILTSIFNMEIVIIKDYETEKKEIGEIYKKFCQEYKLPKNILTKIEEDKYLNYYYSNEEKEKYIKKWKEKIKEEYFGYKKEEYDLYMKISQENTLGEEIQKSHYIDNGCYCIKCNKKREEIRRKAKKGIELKEKIVHRL